MLLSGPFTQQIRQRDRWKDFVSELGGPPVHLVWIRSDRETLRSRLEHRGLERDTRKLERFDEFLAATRADVPPPIPHIAVDNRAEAPPLTVQLEEMF